jgi:hypothetical protein
MQAGATLDTSQTIAVSQQLVAWAGLVGGEGFWAMQRMQDKPGRPGLAPTVAGAVSMLVVR